MPRAKKMWVSFLPSELAQMELHACQERMSVERWVRCVVLKELKLLPNVGEYVDPNWSKDF